MTLNATASIVGTSNGSGGYDYTITLNDTGSTTIGTYWFGWVPGEDFLTQDPTSIGSPNGWNGSVFPASGGYSIEWTANSSASYLQAGGSSAAFTFSSTETPAQMAANSTLDTRYPATTSFVYQGQPFADNGLQFTTDVGKAAPPVESASGTITPLEITPGNFQYTIALTDTGTTTVGTFWFAWDDSPDQDFMSAAPTSINSPSGWTDFVTTHNYPGGGTGYGIEWISLSSGADMNPNDVVSSFTFDSTETPTQLAATQQFNDQSFGTDFQTTSSFVYSGGAEATPGGNFVVAVECFAAGTKIRTPRGDVPIETLRPGDLIVTETADIRTINWAGRRRVRYDEEADQDLPVRIARGALAPLVPRDDLWLSSGHALHFDGVLIPVKYLVNGSTIARMPVDAITWHHLELETHDVLLAEGAPAESYLDTGNRAAFEPLGGANPRRRPGRTDVVREAAAHLPLVVTGPILARVRRRLAERALAIAPEMPFGPLPLPVEIARLYQSP